MELLLRSVVVLLAYFVVPVSSKLFCIARYIPGMEIDKHPLSHV